MISIIKNNEIKAAPSTEMKKLRWEKLSSKLLQGTIFEDLREKFICEMNE